MLSARPVNTGLHRSTVRRLVVGVCSDQRATPERLCRHIISPRISEKWLSLTGNGKVRYKLKTRYCDGTTRVILEPLDFIARLATLLPKRRVHLIRFHGVFAPNSENRVRVTLGKRDRGAPHMATQGLVWW